MSYTEYVFEATDLTLYAKALPLNTDTWSTGVVAFTENGSTGQYAATLDEATYYFVYSQSGGSPASTDLVIGSISPANLTANTISNLSSSITSAAGIGTDTARSIVVTVDDTGNNLVSGARVSVLTNLGVATGQVKTTDSSGEARLILDDGSYKLRVTAPSGYVSPSDTDITVTSSETPVTIELATTSVPVNPDPGMCTVFTYVKNAQGDAVENAVMRAWITTTGTAINGALLSNRSVAALSDATGYVSLDLVRLDQIVDGSGTYQITIHDVNNKLMKSIAATIPNQDSINLEDL